MQMGRKVVIQCLREDLLKFMDEIDQSIVSKALRIFLLGQQGYQSII
jgi:hypothetical protein